MQHTGHNKYMYSVGAANVHVQCICTKMLYVLPPTASESQKCSCAIETPTVRHRLRDPIVTVPATARTLNLLAGTHDGWLEISLHSVVSCLD